MDDETLKQVFKSLHADITNDVNPDKLIDVLYSKNLIGDGDYSDLWEVSDSRKRCRSLLLLLQRSSRTETFTHVREALRDEYPWIVDKIDAQLASLTAQQQHLSRSTDGDVRVSAGASSRDGQAAQNTSYQQLQHGDTVERFRQKYLSSDADVTDTIWTGCDVVGVTSVYNELFVLLRHLANNQVAVYSINDNQPLHHLNVPRYKPHVHSDITSCVRHKCLYMSDRYNSCIHRYKLASGATSKWSVPGQPRCLSVTPNCNLLVTCRYPNKLVELSVGSGEIVREIALQSDIVNPWHSVLLTTGQYVVSHSTCNGLHQVCVVGDDGKVTRSYGGKRGSDVGQVNYPCHLAVDKDSQFIFVADHDNARVVLLSPTLEFVRCVSEGLAQPWRLYFHQATRRLFVVQFVGVVSVIQL